MGVTVVLGKNGAGKDMAAMQYGVLPAWQYGRAVAANCSLYPEELGFSEDLYYPLNEPLHDLPRLGRHMKRLCRRCRKRCHPDADACRRCGGELVDVPRMHPDGGLWSVTENKGVGLLISDVTAAFPSRESVGLPPELAQTLQQLRKPDISPVVITCPAWARVDILLRECMTLVIESYAWNPVPYMLRKLMPGTSRRFCEPPDVPWGWPKNKAFERFFYDPESYERAAETGNWTGCEPIPQGLLNRPSRKTWRQADVAVYQRAYDSFEDIELADHIACGECGGRLPRTSCKDPIKHREHSRSMRAQRERDAYPIPTLAAAGLGRLDDALIAELTADDGNDEHLRDVSVFADEAVAS